MDIRLRKAQLKILEAFAKQPESFALAGGSALELFYLNHRFSRDLDFFSPQYNLGEIEGLVSRFENYYGKHIVLYDTKINNPEVIRYLEREIESFIREELL